ncbi:hypothetical protein Q3G72_025355 [Acer saccharum]|nr:hypothetical protein Q3G72_025355 [Acer saccharum]
MKELIGSQGTVSGLVLRIGQCAFAAASVGFMVSASGFSGYTAFCYDYIPYSNVSCNAIVEIEGRRIKIRKLESGNEIGMFLQQCLKISLGWNGGTARKLLKQIQVMSCGRHLILI